MHHIKDGPRLKPRTPCVFIFVCVSKLKCCGLVSPLGLIDAGLHFSCCCNKPYGCLLLSLRFYSFLFVISETESIHSVGTFRNKTNNLNHSVGWHLVPLRRQGKTNNKNNYYFIKSGPFLGLSILPNAILFPFAPRNFCEKKILISISV